MSLSCNGINQYVDFGNDASFDLVGAITVTMRVRIDQYRNWNQIVGKTDQNAGANECWGANVSSGFGGYLGWAVNTVDVGRISVDFHAGGNPLPPLGIPFFFAGRHLSGGNICAWINGDKYISVIGGNIVVNSAIPVYYGVDCNFAYGYFDGQVSDLRIYDRALSDEEIIIIYNSHGSDNIKNGLILHSLFSDKPSGTNSDNSVDEIKDISGNENHGTCFNSPVFYGASVPTNVAATDGTYTTKVRVSWDTVVGATSYKVYRADTESGDYTELDTGITDLYYDDSTVVPETVYWYKVKATDDWGDTYYSAADSGYATVVITYPIIEDAPSTKRSRLVIFGDIDLVALGYVGKLIKIEEEKTFDKDKLISNEVEFEVKNFDNFFSIDNNTSHFKSVFWRYQTIKYYNMDGILEWDGIILKIVRDHATKLAKIISTDMLAKFSETAVEYSSSDWETPAAAFEGVCAAVGFLSYNQASVQASDAQYEEAECYIKCNFLKDDGLTFQQAIEKLGEIGCADVYNHLGIIYFKHWRPFTGGVSVYLDGDDLRSAPVVDEAIDELINDYRIGYDGDAGTPAVDADNNSIGAISRIRNGTHSLADINGDGTGEITVKDLTSAMYIGECYIRRTHRALASAPMPLQKIEFTLAIDYWKYFNLNTFFRLTLTDEDWDEKLFEIYKMEKDETEMKFKMLAYEVAS
jgi:hypothetical protein